MSEGVNTMLGALASIRQAPTLLAGLERIEGLLQSARAEGSAATPSLAEAVHDLHDQLTGIAAIHAAAAAGARTASAVVMPLLASDVPYLREHAVWALARSPRLGDAVAPLVSIRASGGFEGMLAEATLAAWGETPAEQVDPSPGPGADSSRLSGLTVAQLFLHADIEGSLLHAGEGDTGGIATLLVQLGDALLTEGRVARVLTLSRGRPGEQQTSDELAGPGHHYVSVPLSGPILRAADAWPLRVPVRRGLRRILRAAGRVDVLHLRMADVGSWAASEVARELGIPTVFTLAPDPHALIAAREASGALTRANFGAADHAEHLVFRVRLVRELARQAAHVVVFPRTELARDLHGLLDLDTDGGVRLTVVPEGIDLAPHRRAERDVADALRGVPPPDATAAALAQLDAALESLPPGRRGLPLAITVGRLHRVKGMAALVEAWASDPALVASCNLLVVGGDLDHPSEDENEQLARIDVVVPRADGPARGLLLAGHRPNGTVAVWLAAVRHGRPGLSAPQGVYVSASLKEEFGIAILEAMASGLVVVAPVEGGPATYVENGVSGFIVDTTDPAALGGGLASALALAAGPGSDERADRATEFVTERFSIETMASALATIYSGVRP